MAITRKEENNLIRGRNKGRLKKRKRIAKGKSLNTKRKAIRRGKKTRILNTEDKTVSK